MIQVKFDGESKTRLAMVWDEPSAPVPHDEDVRASEALFSILDKLRRRDDDAPLDS